MLSLPIFINFEDKLTSYDVQGDKAELDSVPVVHEQYRRHNVCWTEVGSPTAPQAAGEGRLIFDVPARDSGRYVKGSLRVQLPGCRMARKYLR